MQGRHILLKQLEYVGGDFPFSDVIVQFFPFAAVVFHTLQHKVTLIVVELSKDPWNEFINISRR